MTRGQRKPCEGGCGRMVQGREGYCEPCQQGKPPPEANPKLHRSEYLIRCIEELVRRRDEADSVLQKARAA